MTIGLDLKHQAIEEFVRANPLVPLLEKRQAAAEALNKAQEDLRLFAQGLAELASPLKVGDVTSEEKFRELAKSITGRDYSYTYIPHGSHHEVRVTQIMGRFDGDQVVIYYRGVVLKKDGSEGARTTSWSWWPPKSYYRPK
jgi:LytS/YehU family sensor histidine kinase